MAGLRKADEAGKVVAARVLPFCQQSEFTFGAGNSEGVCDFIANTTTLVISIWNFCGIRAVKRGGCDNDGLAGAGKLSSLGRDRGKKATQKRGIVS